MSEANKTTLPVEARPQTSDGPPPQTALQAPSPARLRAAPRVHPFACPRDFLNNRHVYVTLSQRARGLSIGVNLNPDKHCNFDCVYCEVDRRQPLPREPLDVPGMTSELQRTMEIVHSGQLRHQPGFSALPDELLALRHVALSGDGEPTLCPEYIEAVESVVHLRASGRAPFFKLVLITNATGLDQPSVKDSLKLFIPSDEIWVKLDAGTQAYMQRVNRPQVPLERVLANIQALAQLRPVIIQSLFPLLDGHEPSLEELEHYVQRLKALQAAGALISMVQIYSATRPIRASGCGHLPLKTLSRIAHSIRTATGLKTEVF